MSVGRYADTDSVESHLNEPGPESGEAFADKIKEQGPQVEAVNWIWEKVTGENLIESIIKPMTGDWAKIAADGKVWINAANAIEQISINLSDNVAKLDSHWEGEAAEAFERHIDVVWAVALYAEAAVARLVARGFNFVSDLSEKLCQKALGLLTQLINRLIFAAGLAFVPLGGWAAAAKLVWDAKFLYDAIRFLVKLVEDVIRAAETLINTAMNIKNALAELPDVRSLSDAMKLGQEVIRSKGAVKESAKEVGEGVTEAEETVEDKRERIEGEAEATG